jgi:uncharacterized protein (DUF924 family)
MFPYWYGSCLEYDTLCQNFQETVRTVGSGAMDDQDEWNQTVDGKMAQIVLFDQLARNAFRGKDEAFAYDAKALGIARDMCKGLIQSKEQQQQQQFTIPGLSGIVYIPYLQFINSPLMHSESLEDHELCVEVLDYTIDVVPDDFKDYFRNTKIHEIDHKVVIEKFGRYPHRNNKLGRDSTPEELEWLSNEDELPAWAKSQG